MGTLRSAMIYSNLIPKSYLSFNIYGNDQLINQSINQSVNHAINQPTNQPTNQPRRYIVLGFLDQGGCKIVSSVRVTYNICPSTTLHESLVDLRETVAPFSVFEPILVEGTCAENSFHIQGSLNVTCESSGQWNVSQFKGKCVCKEDKENVGGTCTGMFRNQYDPIKAGFTYYQWSGQDRCLSMTFLSPICQYSWIRYYG